MSEDFVQPSAGKLSWRFPYTFWIANGAELFERAAFYGMFIELTLFLSRELHFSDEAAGYLGGYFAATIYLLPTFSGLMADKIGFKKALLMAFSLLAVGYALLGYCPSLIGAEGDAAIAQWMAFLALTIVLFGGSIIKPVISGTVSQCSDQVNRARAFSIFYMIVNIGAFTGKGIAAPLRENHGLVYINYYAAVMAFCGLLLVALFYRDVRREPTSRKLDDILQELATVVTNFRFMALIFIVAGFWIIQGQLYASMPKFILRLLGESQKPEWLANINPLTVVIFVVPITHLIRNFRPESGIGIGLFLIPFTAFLAACGTLFDVQPIQLPGGIALPWLTLMVILAIGFQGFAECFLSPKFLEYASRQAPPGQEGLYLGYQHLTTFFAWAVGFALSGNLLNWYCPDPQTLSPAAHAQWQAAIAGHGAMPPEYAHAHYLWFVFMAIGIAAFIGLLVFKQVTAAIDRNKPAA